MSKQIKLKSLLKEGFAWERKPGKSLPTIQEVMAEYEAKQEKESIPPVHVQEVEDMSSKFWVVAKDKRGALYVFNDGYYNTKEEAEEALKNITVPKIVDANTIKVEPVPTSPNYTVLYDNLSEGSLEEKLNESIKHFKNPVNVAKLSLKDTLDLQRTAKIITESQYKKLLNEAVEIPSWLEGKLKDVHIKAGQGSIFAKPLDYVLKQAQDALDKSTDLDKIANGSGTLTINSPGIGYNLVLPIEKAKQLPNAQESETEKVEGPNKIKVPLITTSAAPDQFKTDELTIIVRPKKDESGNVLPGEYIVLSIFPGDPDIPRASEWNGKYAVIMPDAKKYVTENVYYHNGSDSNQIINYDDDITDELESLGQGSMDGQDFQPGETYNIGGQNYKVVPSGDEFKLVLAESKISKLTLKEKLRFQKQAGIITESQYKKLLKEMDQSEIEKKIYDFFYSNKIQQNTGVTSFTTCDEDDWDKVKNYISGKGINGVTGKQVFFHNNPDITEEEFDKYYDEWLDYIEDERNMESRNQQDYNY
jgi:hypothetical protein